MRKKAKVKQVDISYEVMSTVSEVIDFIRTQVVSDMKTASDKGLVKIDDNNLRRLSSILQESITASFSKSASQIENKVKQIT